MYDEAKVANKNNRNLQKSIRGFRSRQLQPENRPIKSFPKLDEKELLAYRKKMRRIGLTRRIISFVIYAIVFIIVIFLVSRFQ